MLTTDQVTKFQTLYEQRFGKKISREQALEEGLKLMRLVELTYKPMTEEEYKNIQKERNQNG